MKCSICGTPRQEDAEFCPTCGCRYLVADPGPAELPPPSRKRHPILIPTILLMVMFVTGLILFFQFPMNSSAVSPTVPGISQVPPDPIPSTEPRISQEETAEAETRTIQTDCFTLTDGVLYFDPEVYTGGRVLQIPDFIGGEAVLAIGESCFRDCDFLTTILLPSNLQAIGPNAFADCDSLRGMFVPEQVTYISADAFAGCSSLEALYIPTSVARIESGAFDACPAVRYIFYNGLYEDWTELYSDQITPFTYVICWDGDYRHGANWQ